MDDPLPINNPLFYSRSTTDPIFKITLDELLTPVPPNYMISSNFNHHHHIQIPKDDLEPIKEFSIRPYTFFMSYNDFHRSSYIFNYIIFRTKVLNFPIVPYNPNYVGICGNLLALIENSLFTYEPFRDFEESQITNHFLGDSYITRIMIAYKSRQKKNRQNNEKI